VTTRTARREATFDPGVSVADPTTRAWLRQATLRLRREVAWRWHERDTAATDPNLGAVAANSSTGSNGAGPHPSADPLIESLDLMRHWAAKQAFFEADVASRYLTERLDATDDGSAGPPPWTIRGLVLDDVAALALALGLLARVDAAAGPIFGACIGDARRTEPSLALVQRLASRPEATLALADPSHPLWRLGLIQPVERTPGAIPWDVGYGVPPLVAARLIDPGAAWPAGIDVSEPGALDAAPAASALDDRIRDSVGDRLRTRASGLRIVPVEGPRGADARGAVMRVADTAGRRLGIVTIEAGELALAGGLQPLLTSAWLGDLDLMLTVRSVPAGRSPSLADVLAAASAIPVTAFVVGAREMLATLPYDLLLPTVAIRRLGFEDRVARWRTALGGRAPELEGALPECARRFRFEVETIDAVASGLAARPGRLDRADLFAACRAALSMEISGLAQPVEPRFAPNELVLPPKQHRQVEEIEAAMRSLTEVHYTWGTARAWNEAGIAVLFAGPSGTGKTMAAEVLAASLDIPMFRVNLAQVVDKYIGETEKNLERIFDAADASDSIIFFDEADALFGKRTDVRDAHDRYANIEVAYLLERMERFKGLAILATNRRGDLDEAFLRRLRYIVDFPIPDTGERRRIWERVIPSGVDAGELDFDFLARQFQLTGGNIRSAVLNACLQTAAAEPPSGDGPRTARPALSMDHILVAVKREHEKFQRTVGPAQLGPYATLVEALTRD
jgi:hypothetical protein